MKRAGYLFERAISFENLYPAAIRAFRGKKEKSPVSRFHFHLESELIKLEADLRSESYEPAPYGVFTIYEPKERQICCSSFRDRVVHHAICRVNERRSLHGESGGGDRLFP